MAIGGYFRSWIERSLKAQLGYADPLDPTKFRLILCTDAVWTAEASITDILLTEINNEYGYGRDNYAVAEADITYDATRKTATVPIQSWDLTASGASIQWDGIAMIANAHPNAPTLLESVDPATDTLTLTGHGLANGDRVMLTVDAGGALPTGVDGTVLYYAVNTSADTFQVSPSEGGSPMAFSDTGAGDLRLRYGSGELVAGFRADSIKTIPDGATHTLQWNFLLMNSALSSGTSW
ncbi:MAG: hypothetical protein SAJ12_03835 [Jaaginema sp. PMC 1079.18]|nr:hypothetical protein [Jaaginema sp. PMC 1080.18]MEC4850120.1 hypothetical protein [Jaaginema sp. PMC 1079.18]MEC4864792.1 hypothetical protein [Jaaginema sp. PMC 1078.18]